MLPSKWWTTPISLVVFTIIFITFRWYFTFNSTVSKTTTMEASQPIIEEQTLQSLESSDIKKIITPITSRLPITGIKYNFERNNIVLSYKEALQLLEAQNIEFIDILTSSIEQFPSPAVFWECIPVTYNQLSNQSFEYVILPAKELNDINVNITPFQDKFKDHIGEPNIKVFSNLKKDAVLIVPTPNNEEETTEPPSYFAHLSKFIRGAKIKQIQHFWQNIGASMLNTLASSTDPNKKLWLSTSGLGVSWLHVRIDTRPKYYNYIEYKKEL